MRLLIGTRGSPLARAQTRAIQELLSRLHPDLEISVRIIRTRGDVTRAPLATLGGQGAFTGELETALRAGQADLAVHSLKDLPTRLHPDLQLVATPPREDVRDVLIAPGARSLDELPAGATVGTGSPRRRAQLLALRPDLRIGEIRGNLETRLALARDGQVDAVVVAAAGLHRLGWKDRISAYFPATALLPAAGQAALGLEMRRDHPLLERVRALNHAPTWQAVTAERCLLSTLGGGCHAPLGAWARVHGDTLILDGAVGRADGTVLLRHRATALPTAAAALGREVAAALRQQGAHRILGATSSSA